MPDVTSYAQVLYFLEEGGLDNNALRYIDELLADGVKPTPREAYELIAEWSLDDVAGQLAFRTSGTFKPEQLYEVLCCVPKSDVDTIIFSQLCRGLVLMGEPATEVDAYSTSKEIRNAIIAACAEKGRRMKGETVCEFADTLSNDALCAGAMLLEPRVDYMYSDEICAELSRRGFYGPCTFVIERTDCEQWERQLLRDQYLPNSDAPQEKSSGWWSKPVAATLVKLKEGGGLLKTAAYMWAGDSLAGTPGAIAGLLLSGTGFVAHWDVLYDNGMLRRERTTETSKRSEIYDNLPNVEDYQAMHAKRRAARSGIENAEQAHAWAKGYMEALRKKYSSF